MDLDPRYAATAGLEISLDLPTARARAAEIRAHAEQPEHVYLIGSDNPPGSRPEHVLENGGHRAVFSLTKGEDGTIYRHASISLQGAAPGRHPTPPAVFTLATLFGFTGGKVVKGITLVQGDDWSIDAQVDQDGLGLVSVVQVFEGGT